MHLCFECAFCLLLKGGDPDHKTFAVFSCFFSGPCGRIKYLIKFG